MFIRKISPSRKDVAELLRQSDQYAAGLYPAESNHLDDRDELSKPNVFFSGAFEGDRLVAIGAVKLLADDGTYGEIKRVFVLPDQRGKGVSRLIMQVLENHLKERGVSVARLETGVKQPEAIGLYKSLGYRERGPFGAYIPDPLSLFMEKDLWATTD